mmetsp:Transcript_78751/g.207282  ORF Transcript_78751/g.207282 Transcript_78751/m.207282 type:complete len:311 (+) Transcript_78751:120-1052(+)
MSQFIEVVGTSEEGLARVTRLWLKSFMQQFGEVIQIHKPPSSGDPKSDVATVRFGKQEQAEAAVAFLKSGSALLNGTPISGDFKSQSRGGRPSSGVLDYDAPVVDSRSFLGGGSRRERSPSRRAPRRGNQGRERSDSHRRGPPTRRSRSRSRGGPRQPAFPGYPRGPRAGAPRDLPRSPSPPPRRGSGGGGGGGRGGGGGGFRCSRSRGGGDLSPSRRCGSSRSRSPSRSHSARNMRQVPPPQSTVGSSSFSAAPPAAEAPRKGLSAEEKAELESLQARATEEEKEMEELRGMMAAREAQISQLINQMSK